MEIIFVGIIIFAMFFVVFNFSKYVIPSFFNAVSIILIIITQIVVFFFNVLCAVFKFIFRIKPKVFGKVSYSDTYTDSYRTKSGILRKRETTVNRSYNVDKHGKVVGKSSRSKNGSFLNKGKRDIF